MVIDASISSIEQWNTHRFTASLQNTPTSWLPNWTGTTIREECFFVESFQFGSFWSLLQKTLISWNSLIRTTPCISMYLSHETDWAWQSSICVKGPFNQLVEGTCCRKPLYFDHSQWETPVHVPLIQFSESMLFLRNKAKTISFIYRGYIYICISYIYLYNPIYYIYI